MDSRIFGVLLAALTLGAPAVRGQRRPSTTPNIRLDVNLVLVPVTVTGHNGITVTGLGQSQFHLFEDRVPKEILSFSREQEPVSIGVIFDLSGSMRGRLAEASASIRALFRAAEDSDEALLVTFSNQPEAVAAFTTNLDAIASGLGRARAGGATALIDAVYLGLDRMRHANHGRKALVIVSDGMDNHSRYSRQELLSRAVEADVQIYTIGLFDPRADKKPLAVREEREGIRLLEDLSRATGGLHYQIRDAAGVPHAAAKIGVALHNQYVLGFRPDDSDSVWHRIQVKVDAPNVRCYTRAGFLGAH